ncbi:SDR family NAD(P)-dependent oxidoreductase [Mycobacterium simulans]|uniref:SDR family NAD(P)-dependent oxidoreductase n=1 Tax=Mycobacterium simulans TaxID=627089 RepID=UPI001CD30263|nr:SDR family NAD(P)-dependent oxidoreductase [Mycobacterium simulans]
MARDHPDLDTLATALAQLHVHGHSPSWTTLYPDTHTVALPTYPFQHRPYWLAAPAGVDVSAAGLDKPGHPLLGALTDLADQDQIVLTGRLSTTTHDWLAGHRVDDTVLFPGTGYIELLLQAGEYAQCPVIDELVLHTPLTLDEHAPTDVQITVQAMEDNGRRPVTVYSRTSATHGHTAWTLHASGALSTTAGVVSGPLATPSGVDAIDADSFYQDLAEHGFHYQTPFRSLRGISRHPTLANTVYAEVALPADTDITDYGIHPALLDAALHPLAAAFDQTEPSSDPHTPRIPFAFTGVTLHAIQATRLHVQLTSTGADTFTLRATDPTGAPVITIDTLTLRARPDHIRPAAPAALRDSLFHLHWPPLPEDAFPAAAAPPAWAVLTEDPDQLPASLRSSPRHTELAHAELAIWPLPLPDPAEADDLQRVHTLTRATVTQLQDWLTRSDTLDSHLVILTRHAVSINVYDRAPDLAHAAAWALIHTAQNEHPGRITALDIDTTAATDHALINVLAALATPTPAHPGEPQLALRDGIAHTPRLTPSLALSPPPTPTWQLSTTGNGGLAGLALVPTEAATELAPGQIRVTIRASGLNFRDVDAALGATPDSGIGREGAGVVIETAPDVTTVAPGDAVMGLFPNNAFAPTAITDHRMVVGVPAGWSFTQAASVPVAFLTAYTALVEHAQLRAGQRVLIHAATGGVGQAAIQIAQHLGAEIFATAGPHKHRVLTDLGIPDHHIASSRTREFLDFFDHASDGQGMDVIFNTLPPDFIEGSLQLLSPGGCFLQIATPDIRAAGDVNTTHPAVDYLVYDLTTTHPDDLGRAWNALIELFTTGALRPLATTSYGLVDAPQAFSDMSQALHTGKIVLTPPTTLTPDGTVLITGGTGMLGQLFAEHLITHHGVRHLLLASRRGPTAPGATELHQHLANLGAQVTIAACDTSNPAELTTLLADIPAQHPLTAIIHTAGALHDAVITEITTDQLDSVLGAKADTAWHLHQLTTDQDLDAFIMFSSVSATLGAPGQGAYTAANAFLDALAQQRHRAAITIPAATTDPREELLDALHALTTDQPHPGVTYHHHQTHHTAKTVFVFPGQGAQYPTMATTLYTHHRVFAAALDACDQALHPWTGWSVRDVLHHHPDAPPLDRVDVIQPVLFTIMISLAELLRTHGITPDAVIGHSQGEIAAAYIAGALPLNQAAKIVALRSQALTTLSGHGAMASVRLTPDELPPHLQPFNTTLTIAATNGPTHTIISGHPDALDQFSTHCQQHNIHIRTIAVDYASHSPQVEHLRHQLLDNLTDLTPQPSTIPLYTTVPSAHSDQPLNTTTMDADYWYRNLREPVHFHDTITTLTTQSPHTFIELSPHPVLAPALTDTLTHDTQHPGSAVITTMHRDLADLDALATAMARLHSHGHSPSWTSLYPDTRTVELPTYPFQHRPYWLAASAPSAVSDPAEGRLWDAVDNDAVDIVAQVLGITDTPTASLGSVVAALRHWRKHLAECSVVDKLRYQISWQAITPTTFPPTRQRWLVLTRPGQSEDPWLQTLVAHYPEEFVTAVLDPDRLDRDELAALLVEHSAAHDCDGVLSVLALFDHTTPDVPGPSAGVLSTLSLVQAYGDSGLSVPLWVLTQGGAQVSADERPLAPSQAAVWGLGQSVCLEHPDWWGGLIDLPATPTAQDVTRLHTILTCPQTEDQLALRPHGVHARRLRHAPLSPDQRPSWKPSGTAVITGITGRSGPDIARWLADAGASHLVLLSRTAATDPHVAELEKEFHALGVSTTSASIDLTDQPALAAVIDQTRAEHGPIDTVVHAAAFQGWATITETTLAEFHSTYSAKALGAENLITALGDQLPHTFILFSSAATTWGGTRQGAYAAANAHIEALTTQLRARGCHALAPAWGTWADDRTASQETLDYLARIGLRQIPADTAFTALQQSLDNDDTLITLTDVDWDQFHDVFTTRRAHPLLSELGSRPTPTGVAAIPDGLAAQLAGHTPDQQRATLTTLIQTATAAVLAHPDPANQKERCWKA